MVITINGERADIVLEDEKTLGDALAALDEWLQGSGSRLSGVAINGETLDAEGLDRAFGLELSGLETLDLRVSLWDEIALEAFGVLRDYALLIGEAPFEEREGLRRAWEESPSGTFLAEDAPEVFDLARRGLRGEGLSPGEVLKTAEERLRELEDPWGELHREEPLVDALVSRLEDLPLDLQTGKDAKAGETVLLFSRIGEKLFRILAVLRRRGLIPEDQTLEGENIHRFIENFNAILKEFIGAYESHDPVLMGDLAEYEIAPRLSRLFAILR